MHSALWFKINARVLKAFWLEHIQHLNALRELSMCTQTCAKIFEHALSVTNDTRQRIVMHRSTLFEITLNGNGQHSGVNTFNAWKVFVVFAKRDDNSDSRAVIKSTYPDIKSASGGVQAHTSSSLIENHPAVREVHPRVTRHHVEDFIAFIKTP